MSPVVALLSRGPAWPRGRSLHDVPVMLEHREYLRGLISGGRLEEAGPLLPFDEPVLRDPAGLLVFRSDDAAEAEALLAADPAAIDGTVRYEIFPWLSR